MSGQLNLFQHGQDLPLFQAAQPKSYKVKPIVGSHGKPITCSPAPAPEPMPPCPICGDLTSWEHYPDGAPSLVICEPCGAFWTEPEEVHQP